MKKSIIVLLVMTMILSLFPSVYTAEASEAEIYGYEIKLLEDLGIVTTDIADAPNEAVATRAELVVLALRALGQDKLVNADYRHSFDDVPTSHWAYSYIMYAAQSGLLNGIGDNKFAPDEPIDASQAVCVMLRMLNWDIVADDRGGYPNGYWKVAISKSLLDNTGLSENTRVTRDKLYTLIYNTINADYLEYTGTGLEEQIGKSILNEYHKVYFVEGIVTADATAAIEGSPTDNTQKFCIDSYTFTYADETSKARIGRNTRVYYRENNNQKEVVSLWEKDNTEITFVADSILDFDYPNGIYTISNGIKDKKLNIGDNYKLIYNDESIVGSDEALMIPSNGHVTLIENDGDSIYDIVLVYNCDTYVFGRYNAYSETITDKLDISKTLNLRDYEVSTTIEDFSRLKEDTILTVFISNSGKSVKIVASDRSFAGTVDQIGETSYIINGEEYKASPVFDKDLIKLGVKTTFYLDYFERIAYARTSSAYRYGYITKIASGTFSETDTAIFTSSGKLEIYRLANKVKVIDPQSSNENLTPSSVIAKLGAEPREFILYKLNNENKINEIVLPKIISTRQEYQNTSGYELYKLDYYIEQWPDTAESYREFKKNNLGFGNWLILDSSSTVFTVPSQTSADLSEDKFNVQPITTAFSQDHKINIVKSANDIDGKKGNQEIDIYKIGDAGHIPDVLLYYDTTENKSTGTDGDFAVVKKITQCVDGEGDASWKLVYLQSGKEYTKMFSPEMSNNHSSISSSFYINSSNMKPVDSQKSGYVQGDIVKISTDRDGRINNMPLMYDSEAKKIMALKGSVSKNEEIGLYNGLFRMVTGVVDFIDDDYFEMTVNTEENDGTPSTAFECSKIASNTTITVVEPQRNETVVCTGASSDIGIGDRVVIYSRYSENRHIVVYKTR